LESSFVLAAFECEQGPWPQPAAHGNQHRDHRPGYGGIMARDNEDAMRLRGCALNTNNEAIAMCLNGFSQFVPYALRLMHKYICRLFGISAGAKAGKMHGR
jgi:hypothetical protein